MLIGRKIKGQILELNKILEILKMKQERHKTI